MEYLNIERIYNSGNSVLIELRIPILTNKMKFVKSEGKNTLFINNIEIPFKNIKFSEFNGYEAIDFELRVRTEDLVIESVEELE